MVCPTLNGPRKARTIAVNRWNTFIPSVADKTRVLGIVRRFGRIGFTELRHMDGSPPDRLEKTIKALEGDGSIDVVRVGTRRFLSLPSEPSSKRKNKRRPAQILLRFLRTSGRQSQRDVIQWGRSNGWPRSTTQYRLAQLVASGRVLRERSGRTWQHQAPLRGSPRRGQ